VADSRGVLAQPLTPAWTRIFGLDGEGVGWGGPASGLEHPEDREADPCRDLRAWPGASLRSPSPNRLPRKGRLLPNSLLVGDAG